MPNHTFEEVIKKLKPGEDLIITHQLWNKDADGGLHIYLLSNKGYIEVGSGISSIPPVGAFPVVNIHVEKDGNGEPNLSVFFDETNGKH